MPRPKGILLSSTACNAKAEGSQPQDPTNTPHHTRRVQIRPAGRAFVQIKTGGHARVQITPGGHARRCR
eukprot:1842366-Rhodomonas_salina.2